MNSKVEEAYLFAKEIHEGQKRKGGEEAYINHLVQVYEIVRKISDDEAVHIAALLHDSVEDTKATYEEIETRFGKTVRSIVEEVSTDKKEKKIKTWKQRKQETIESIYTMSEEARYVEIADKVANASNFSKLLDESGKISFKNFNEQDISLQEWYYRSLYEAFCESTTNQKILELAAILKDYTNSAFGRSYEEYQRCQKPLLIEIVGTNKQKNKELMEEVVDSLLKKNIKTSTILPFNEDSTISEENLVAMIRKTKQKNTDVIITTDSLIEKQVALLTSFEKNKATDPSCVYDIVEKLNTLKEAENNYLNGVVALYQEPASLDDTQQDLYNDHLLGALDTLEESIPYIVLTGDQQQGKDQSIEVTQFILSTIKEQKTAKRPLQKRK